MQLSGAGCRANPINPKGLGVSSLGSRVGIYFILGAQSGSHMATSGPGYILYSYMDALGKKVENAPSTTACQERISRCFFSVLLKFKPYGRVCHDSGMHA